MAAAPGIVTASSPPNAVVQVQPGMNVQAVVLVDSSGNYVSPGTTSPPGIPGQRLACMGNSIAANGNNPADSTLGYWGTCHETSFLQWACLLSGGQLQYAGSFATGGYTSTQINSTWLADVIAAKPDMCIVGPMFTNNYAYSVPLAQTITDIELACNEMLAAGILPVLSLDPPYNVAANSDFILQCNMWAQRYASLHALPVVDFFTPLTTTAGLFNPVYTSAALAYIHPNGAGAQIMGQAICNVLLGTSRANPPLIYPGQISGDTIGLYTNPLFQNSSGGVPAGWTTGGTGATFAVAVPASTPPPPRVAANGNLWTVTRGSTDATGLAGPFTVTPGDKLHITAHVESSVLAVGGTGVFRLTNFTTDLYGVTFTSDIPGGCVLSGEVIVPAGMTSASLYVAAETAAGAVMNCGQVTLVDLTAKGMTS